MQVVDLVKSLPKHSEAKYKTRATSSIRQIVIHHSATSGGTPEAFARYHVEKQGWPGIGYAYVIGQAGQVWKTNNAATISYHAKGANSDGLGVCLVGNFDLAPPEEKQWQAAAELVEAIMEAYPSIMDIVGHREVPGTKKSCPGKFFDMAAFRLSCGQK